MTHKFLEHESDLYIEGCGKTLFNAMNEIGNGVVETLKERETVDSSRNSKKSSRLMISDRDEKSLIINVFSEIISEIESENIQPYEITINTSKISSPLNLTAEINIKGYDETPANIIKAVTWHNLEIIRDRDNNKICIRLLFDI